MPVQGNRVKRTRLVQKGRYVVAVEVEMVVPPDDPGEPCCESETVELLREVAERAEHREIPFDPERSFQSLIPDSSTVDPQPPTFNSHSSCLMAHASSLP